ncbi:MAG: glycosyltransferase family A protein [Pseudomonadota bacterium]
MTGETDLLERPAGGHHARQANGADTAITILVPTFRDDVSPLLRELGACEDAAHTELVVFDDGSGNAERLDTLRAELASYPGKARLIASPINLGRASARNALLTAAETEWVILLDADMVPDDPRFLTRYRQSIAALAKPGLICGGGSTKRVNSGEHTALHLAQSRASECIAAAARNRDAGRFVFTGNIAVHRDVFRAVPLDSGYSGWGWEDVDWGLSVVEHFPVRHIDNTATHLGLMDDAALLAKYATSGANFARLARRHPEAAASMPLFKAARALRVLGILRAPLSSLMHRLARQRGAALSVRLFCLKLFRALVYSRALS